MELHDTVGATLFTIGAGIRELGRTLDDASTGAHLRAIGRQTAEASVALRRSLRVLSAPPEQLALSVALRQHCRTFQERTTIPARLIVLTEVPAMEPSKVTALSEAVREALRNTEKHAEATFVVVTVHTGAGRMVVTVSDDGVGLPAECVPGIGLTAAGERISRAGGELTVSPGDDSGVTVRAG